MQSFTDRGEVEQLPSTIGTLGNLTTVHGQVQAPADTSQRVPRENIKAVLNTNELLGP